MYQKILTPRANPVVTPAQLAAFGGFDVPTICHRCRRRRRRMTILLEVFIRLHPSRWRLWRRLLARRNKFYIP